MLSPDLSRRVGALLYLLVSPVLELRLVLSELRSEFLSEYLSELRSGPLSGTLSEYRLREVSLEVESAELAGGVTRRLTASAAPPTYAIRLPIADAVAIKRALIAKSLLVIDPHSLEDHARANKPKLSRAFQGILRTPAFSNLLSRPAFCRVDRLQHRSLLPRIPGTTRSGSRPPRFRSLDSSRSPGRI